MSKRGVLASDIVTRSNQKYTLDDKVSPNFINSGSTPVRIANTIIYPGDIPNGQAPGQFSLDFPGYILEGTVEIEFLDKGVRTANNLVHVYWLKDTCN